MKSKSRIIWVVGVLLAIASVDTVPDPPAVNPHIISVASRLGEPRGGLYERLLKFDRSCASHHHVRWIGLTSTYEPKLPADRIALTRFAADPSPPFPKTQLNLYFRS